MSYLLDFHKLYDSTSRYFLLFYKGVIFLCLQFALLTMSYDWPAI